MKLVTYRLEETVCVGVMDETLSAIHPIPGCGDLTALIASGAPIEPAEETISVFDVELLSPIPHPAQDVICLGINYYDHAAESDAVTGKSDNVPKNPIYFAKRVNEAVAPGASIDSHSDIVADLDYEAELAVVIGKSAYNVSKEDALDYLFSAMNHAMVITGVNLDEGRPTRWKIENSWGDKNGEKGYYVCTDSWFDAYVYQAAVEKEYLGDLAAFAELPPIELDPWDPMGTLADIG